MCTAYPHGYCIQYTQNAFMARRSDVIIIVKPFPKNYEAQTSTFVKSDDEIMACECQRA